MVPSRRARFAALLVALATATGCASAVAGYPVPGDGVVKGAVDTSVLQGADGGPVDELAAATLTDVQDYWEQQFPEAFDESWEDLSGGLYSVDTADSDAAPPPCVDEAIQVEGNAFYCPDADSIAWDRAALLPVLQERHGDTAVVVVLAHEVGHAVHHRLGVNGAARAAEPGRYPTILTEAMADCYAGAFVRHVVDGDADHLRIDEPQLDSALGALVTFRDPVGTTPDDAAAHGNAFDRVSSFQDGYEQGPQLCASFSIDDREFTQTTFSDERDASAGGNLPFDELVTAITPNLDEYFSGLVGDRGGEWSAPEVTTADEVPDCAVDQGPAGYCPESDDVAVDGTGQLPELHDEIGDYATGTLLATRYGLAALDDLDRPVEGADAGRAALCLAGTYTGALLTAESGFVLSPGDLDEAVQVLLDDDYGSRDVRGTGTPSGFDRVGTFRAGTLGGVDACELG